MDRPKSQLILDAAFQVFGAKGYHQAKMEEIAEKAGVGKGTIYEYFKSKAHLFHEMVIRQIEKYFIELEKGLNDETKATDKMFNLIKNHIMFTKDFQTIANKYFTEDLPGLDSQADFKKKMLETYQQKFIKIKEIIALGIKKGEFREVDLDLLSMFFFGSLAGMTNTMLMFNLELDPEEVAQKTMDILINGIKK